MTRDWPTAAELKDLKATDPDRYWRALDSIAERRGVAPEVRTQSAPTGERSGLDALVDHLRQAFSLTEGQTSQLGYIRRGAIYACVTLRADMLSGLPIRVYRLGTGSRGRRVDVRDPLRRLGMPTLARGVRLAEVNTVSEVEGSDLARRLSRPNEDWTGRHVTLDEAVAAGRISREWAEARERQWGVGSAVYQNRVLGEFAVQDDAGVIPLSWVEAAVERWRAIMVEGADLPPFTCAALDVADGGDDRSTLAIRHGNVLAEVRDVTRPGHGMTLALAGITAGVIEHRGGQAVVDAVGVGAGVVSRLRELGRDVVAFSAGEATTLRDTSDELGFVNVRSAAWWGLRERLHPETGDGLALPDDDRLIGDLTAPRWTTTSSGKIALESKGSQRKADRLGRSTDAADAAIMAFWEGDGGQGLDPAWERGRETTLTGSIGEMEW